MTVSTETRKDVYGGDGSADGFSISFEVLEAAHLRVTYTPASGASVVLTQGTNPGYVVESDLSAIKDVFPVSAGVPAPSGSTITIERVVPLTQMVDLAVLTAFDPATHEELFDLGVMADQQLADRIGALESAGAPGSVVAGDGLEFLGDGVTLRVKPSEPDPASIISGPTGVRVGTINDDQHSARGGGTLHAVATTSVAGFQSATDKTRQDALWARTITAGAGLSGGGNLSADRTLNVVAADSSIVVNPDSIQVGVISDAQHGARGRGTLHQVATTAEAGFMSAADKAKLDGLAQQSVQAWGLVATSDSTPTKLAGWIPADNTSEIVDLMVVARRKSGGGTNGDSAVYRRTFCVRRTDGVTTVLGSPVDNGTVESVAGWDIQITVSSPELIINAVGAAATVVNWRAQTTRVAVEQA